MARHVVQLLPATPLDTRLALEEVKDFYLTDMGYGGDLKWTYRVLQEPSLTEELRRLSQPCSIGSTDHVSLQPCPAYEQRSQDRYIVEKWSMTWGNWTFTAVLDGERGNKRFDDGADSPLGHVTHDTVDYVRERLPPLIRMYLDTTLQQAFPALPAPEQISKVLSLAIAEVDAAITSDFLSMFSEAKVDIATTRPDVMKAFLRDSSASGAHYVRAARMLGGTTVLLTLFEETTSNLWVANLGDCCAGLCVISPIIPGLVITLAQFLAPGMAPGGKGPSLTPFTTATTLSSEIAYSLSIPRRKNASSRSEYSGG